MTQVSDRNLHEEWLNDTPEEEAAYWAGLKAVVARQSHGEPYTELLSLAEWEEAKHPRSHGKFAKTEGEGFGSVVDFASASRTPSLISNARIVGQEPGGKYVLNGEKVTWEEDPSIKVDVLERPSGQLQEEEGMVRDGYLMEEGNRVYNDSLRSGKIIPPPSFKPLADVPGGRAGATDAVLILDSAIARHKLKEDTVLYRGLSSNHTFTVGEVFTDKGYTSTTSDRKVAEGFASMRSGGEGNEIIGPAHSAKVFDGKPVVMEIHVRAGTPAMMGDDSVSEYVLPRNGLYRVHAIKPDGTVQVARV